MDGERPEPQARLARGARSYWRLQALGRGIPAVLVALFAGGALRDGDDALHLLGVLLPIVVVLGALVDLVAIPELRWRRWRWELRDEELDLRHGAFTVTRTIVPISRVQHVDVRRTFISQLCDVSSVLVHTAAGATELPALEEDRAARVRDRIADLARAPDEL